MRLSHRTGLLALFAVLSLATVLLGAVTCHLAGVATAPWLRNLIAWGVGLAAGTGLAFGRAAGPRATLAVLLIALVAVAATFAGEAQEGVHRWIDLGPLHVNLAFVVLPAAVVALAVTAGRRRWIAAFAVLALLVAQPDASQATAFGAAVAVVAWRGEGTAGRRLGLIALAALLVAAGWLRPDPLGAVPEVEEIVALAFSLSPLLAVAAVIAFAVTAAAPAWTTRASPAATAGLALSAYLLTTGLTTVFGAFPMPLLGVGMSPVLGVWLGVGLLAAALDRRTPTGEVGAGR